MNARFRRRDDGQVDVHLLLGEGFGAGSWAVAEAVDHLRAPTAALVDSLRVTIPKFRDPEAAQTHMARFSEEMTGAWRISGEELDRVAKLRESYTPPSRPATTRGGTEL